jgi:hypothetical protein
MILNVYTVRDDKAQAYFNPFFMQNDSLAVRAMTDCVSDPSHQFAKHTADFSLWKLGEYDDTSAKFDLLASPQQMLNLVELKGE